MGFSIDVSVPAATVFLQGLLSFFSPCVLPLIPLYIGYLSGGTGARGEDGRIVYKRSKVMLNTLFFVIGISFAFFVLGLGVSALGTFFKSNQLLFARIGGILVILFGLYQLGVFGASKVLGKERRLKLPINPAVMSPLAALLMGFTFSFAWTPCVGPALTSVLLMTASAKTQGLGILLIGVYTLGFVLPFLAVGLFTTSLLQFFKEHGQVVKYTVKAGGVLLVLMGVLMFTGKMNAVTGYLSDISVTDDGGSGETDRNGGDADGDEDGQSVQGTEDTQDAGETQGTEDTQGSGTAQGAGGDQDTEGTQGTEAVKEIPAVDFTLTDQFGNTHSLEDYKGKTIFLNFWGTWCGPCRSEMPDIQKIYESYDQEGEDALIVLGVAAPGLGQETDKEGIIDFLEENEYTYPVMMDENWDLFRAYGISAYPTTYMIDREGNIFGYIEGQINEEIMESIIRQTMTGERVQ